jgi:hypothetical protein
LVKSVTGSALGPACQTLVSICESGAVRSRWSGHHSGTSPTISKRDWIGADIDWQGFRVHKADDRYMAGVYFSENDLNAWAASRELAAAPIGAPSAPEPAVQDIRDIICGNAGLSKEEVYSQAKRAVGIGRKAFENAWRAHASEQQKARGRRSVAQCRLPAKQT